MRKIASKLIVKTADFKSEARNPKFETNPNASNSNTFSLFAFFERLNFDFFSDFEFFGASNLLGSDSFG